MFDSIDLTPYVEPVSFGAGFVAEDSCSINFLRLSDAPIRKDRITRIGELNFPFHYECLESSGLGGSDLKGNVLRVGRLLVEANSKAEKSK